MTGAMLHSSHMVYSSGSTCWIDSEDQLGRVALDPPVHHSTAAAHMTEEQGGSHIRGIPVSHG
jgi:hypothetical protein